MANPLAFSSASILIGLSHFLVPSSRTEVMTLSISHEDLVDPDAVRSGAEGDDLADLVPGVFHWKRFVTSAIPAWSTDHE